MTSVVNVINDMKRAIIFDRHKSKFCFFANPQKNKKTAYAHLAHLQVAPADAPPKLAKELNLACPPASWTALYLIIISFFFVNTITAQIKSNSEPKFEPFKQVNINQYYTNSTPSQQQQSPIQNTSIGATAQDIINQTNKGVQGPVYTPNMTPQERQQANMRYIQQQMANDPAYQLPNNYKNNRISQQQEILNILNEVHSESGNKQVDMSYYNSTDFLDKSKPYTDAFNKLNNMLTGKESLSISNSYLTIESAYGNTYLSEKEFDEQISQSATFIKQWLIQNGLNPSKNEDLHYGIQRFMKDTLTITIKQPEINFSKTTTHYPFSYDFEDFQAEKDPRNYFISKCIATGSGQCNSLPGTYLAIAEKLGAKSYLSFAPQHSFIKYPDSKGRIHGYEPTSNWKISDKWYIDNMGISNSAINNKIYLDTLNKQMVVANCLLDLAFSYMKQFGAADGKFVSDCINTTMQYFPRKNNIYVYLTYSALLARQLDFLLYSNGIKDIKDIDKVPEAKEINQELLNNEKVIEELGFQKMPESLYLKIMQNQEFKGELQKEQNINKKQKRKMFITVTN